MPLLLILFAASLLLGSSFARDPRPALDVARPVAVAVDVAQTAEPVAAPAPLPRDLSPEAFSFLIDGKIVLESDTTLALRHDKPERRGERDGYFHTMRARITDKSLPDRIAHRVGQTVALYSDEAIVCTARIAATTYFYGDEKSSESDPDGNPPVFDDEARHLVADLDLLSGDCKQAVWARGTNLAPPVFASSRQLAPQEAKPILSNARRIADYRVARREALKEKRGFKEEVEQYTTAAGDYYLVEGTEDDPACGHFVETLLDASGNEVSPLDFSGVFIRAMVDLDGDGIAEMIYNAHGTTLGLMRMTRGRFHSIESLRAAPFCPC